MTKIGRNDKCPCDSGKKYKKCCMVKNEKEKQKEMHKFLDGHDTESERLLKTIKNLKEDHPYHKIIDVTNYLNNKTYEPIQIINYKNKTIMVAERNSLNDDVFATRGPEEVDIMIMYHGAYRCFAYENLERARFDINNMIDM